MFLNKNASICMWEDNQRKKKCYAKNVKPFALLNFRGFVDASKRYVKDYIN